MQTLWEAGREIDRKNGIQRRLPLFRNAPGEGEKLNRPFAMGSELWLSEIVSNLGFPKCALSAE